MDSSTSGSFLAGCSPSRDKLTSSSRSPPAGSLPTQSRQRRAPLTLQGTLAMWHESPINLASSYYFPSSHPIHHLFRRPLQPITPRLSQPLAGSTTPPFSPVTPSFAKETPPRLPSVGLPLSPRSPLSSPTLSAVTHLPDPPSIEITAPDENLTSSLLPSPLTPPFDSPHQLSSPALDNASATSAPPSPNLSSRAQGKQKATEAQVEMRGIAERAGETRKKETENERWFPFGSLEETNGKVINGIKVRQRPQPKREWEKAERDLEWSTPEPGYTPRQVEKAYHLLIWINKEKLCSHHHEFPSLSGGIHRSLSSASEMGS